MSRNEQTNEAMMLVNEAHDALLQAYMSLGNVLAELEAGGSFGLDQASAGEMHELLRGSAQNATECSERIARIEAMLGEQYPDVVEGV